MQLWVLGHQINTQKVTGDFDLVTGETPPQSEGPPPHFHNMYHEVFLITEGEMEFIVDGKTSVLKNGQTINLPPNSIHTFNNKSDNPCKWINIHSPKGFLSFFENLGISNSENNARTKSLDPKIIQKVIETSSKYDMNIIK